LSFWQTGDVARLTFRLAIVPFLLVWAVLTVTMEDMSSFSRIATPMASLVGLGTAAFTLVTRSMGADEAPHCRDWLWVSGGMALYFGTAAALAPLSALLIAGAPHLVLRAYELKSVLDVFAFLAIARGVTCPTGT
jgi:hypothetical protein